MLSLIVSIKSNLSPQLKLQYKKFLFSLIFNLLYYYSYISQTTLTIQLTLVLQVLINYY